MSITNMLFDQYFGRYLQFMYDGIESTMHEKTAYSCALLLSTYTEVMGGLVTGNLKAEGNAKTNYVAFLPFLGESYVTLHKEYDLYKWVRSKLVHEFSPKPNYIIWVNKSITNKSGIDIIDGNLDFNLREYYRDFRCGVEKYKLQFNSSGMIINNFQKAIRTDYTKISLKKKS